ncbi:hypothetical protein HCG51_35175 (plasmid) [Tolypothrix sp. PCC 7910]|jgi:hypothetical protein|uniref:hypothetical protein n=1 Tax=Tolypothrix sp. PCC 7910 TaxID=2099387 RepID=UPI00142777BB|nr:hypothetical protein [Tolypothrix sp. PCC 7910]QIR41920.1 hypothetical protein HCG51_35175 [Tolypothrix sp. PCC 7910]
MNDLQLVGCVTLLTQSKTYSIDGVLYRYLYSSDSIKHTQYLFRPLPAQRKTADLQLNRDKVVLRVYEIPLLYRQHRATMTTTAIQQALF